MPPSVLLAAERLAKSFTAVPLFEGISLTIAEGDRVGLVGPNGSGKSTLLKLLAGLDDPDRGSVTRRRGLRVGVVPQAPAFDPALTVEEVVLAAAAAAGVPPEERPGRVAVTLGRAGLAAGDARVGTLSGGWAKRVAIACALACDPELLLLDEPTNHLDLEGILALEELLAGHAGALVVVSHDRAFLENVTNRTVELDRRHAAGLFVSAGRFSDFLEKRDEALAGQAAYQASLANRVRREIEWLRRGPKARTTKAEARIREAERMIDELADLESRADRGPADVDFTASGRRTKRLLHAQGVSKAFGGRPVIEGLELSLTPGTRLGIVGPNGSGKTTLLRMVAGELAPDAGRIDRAHDLRVVYFEQARETLDLDASLRRALAPDGDTVVYRGRPVHVAGWAQRFLFRTEQLDVPVHRLSGGERARVLIARLMLRPADLLILDEPTNDLDLSTLEVLEESLSDFPGALLLVTHDRMLLDAVSTQVLALDGAGGAGLYADLAQALAASRDSRGGGAAPRPETRGGGTAPRPAAPAPAEKPKRLSYLEQREWAGMEARILAAEDALAAAEAAAADPAIASDGAALIERHAAAAAARAEVERLYARWAELESRRDGG